MKRVLSLLLTAVLLSALCLPAHADGEEEISRRVSEYCEAASMSDYRELFRAAESGGIGRDMTRAMLAGILYNIFGSAEDAETIPSDVDASRWYAAGTAWALKKNIIPNDGNGTFSPDMPITREAFLITLYRCANAYGVSLPAINAWYSFLDGGLMTPEAQTAAFTIQRAGVMIEDTDGYFHYRDAVPLADGDHVGKAVLEIRALLDDVSPRRPHGGLLGEREDVVERLHVCAVERLVAHALHVVRARRALGVDVEHEEAVVAVVFRHALHRLKRRVEPIRLGGRGIDADAHERLFPARAEKISVLRVKIRHIEPFLRVVAAGLSAARHGVGKGQDRKLRGRSARDVRHGRSSVLPRPRGGNRFLTFYPIRRRSASPHFGGLTFFVSVV